MVTFFLRLVLLLSFYLLPAVVFAARLIGFGDVANNLMEPVSVVSQFVSTGAIIIGMCCLFGSFLRYLQYRINPLAAPISSVLILLVIGIVLVLLPWTYKLTQSGVPYHLFNE